MKATDMTDLSTLEKTMRKLTYVRSIGIAALVAMLVGCESDNTYKTPEADPPPPQEHEPLVTEVVQYPMGEISLENVDEVIALAESAIIRSYSGGFGVGGPSEPVEMVSLIDDPERAQQEAESTYLTERACWPQGAERWHREITGAYYYGPGDGERVLFPGDYEWQEYQRCGFTQIFYDGTRSIEIVDGMFRLAYGREARADYERPVYALTNGSIKLTYDRWASLNEDFVRYTHGEALVEAVPLGFRASVPLWVTYTSQRARYWRDAEMEAYWVDSKPVPKKVKGIFGRSETAQEYEVEISDMEPHHLFPHVFIGGTVIVRGENSALEMVYNAYGYTYRVDVTGNGEWDLQDTVYVR